MTRKEFIKLLIVSPLVVLFGKAVKKEEPREVIESADTKMKLICIDDIECEPISHMTCSEEYEYKNGIYVPISAYPEHVYCGCITGWGT